MINPLHAAKHSVSSEDRPFQASMIRGMLTAYDARWGDVQSNINVREIEKQYYADLPNVRSSGRSRTFRLAGKLDKLTAEDATVTLTDHKTTQSDIEDPNSSYWRQIEVEGQPNQYELLLLANGIKVDQVIWDVVRKPAIKPKAIAKKDVAALASLHTYCGQHIECDAFEGMKETPELFELRVAQLMRDQGEKYFQRRSAKRTRSELSEYITELWDISQEIISARRLGRWYRNSGACMLYGTPCPYLGICSGSDTPDSDRWERKESVHEELETDGDGRDLLTNSRVRCFQTCRRKHFYQYELGIKRVEVEDREPLIFGTAWHDAMDVYWSAKNEERLLNEHSNEESAIAVV